MSCSDGQNDRRAWPRISSAVGVHFQLVNWQQEPMPGPIITASTRNISGSGMCIFVRQMDEETLRLLGDADNRPDIVVDVAVSPRPIRLPGRIVWVRSLPSATPSREIGVEFHQINPVHSQALDRYAHRGARRARLAPLGAAVLVIVLAGTLVWLAQNHEPQPPSDNAPPAEQTSGMQDAARQRSRARDLRELAAELEFLAEAVGTIAAQVEGEQRDGHEALRGRAAEIATMDAAVNEIAESLARLHQDAGMRRTEPEGGAVDQPVDNSPAVAVEVTPSKLVTPAPQPEMTKPPPSPASKEEVLEPPLTLTPAKVAR